MHQLAGYIFRNRRIDLVYLLSGRAGHIYRDMFAVLCYELCRLDHWRCMILHGHHGWRFVFDVHVITDNFDRKQLTRDADHVTYQPEIQAGTTYRITQLSALCTLSCDTLRSGAYIPPDLMGGTFKSPCPLIARATDLNHVYFTFANVIEIACLYVG